jgi:hypothetical protein
VLDTPRFIGWAILEISKAHMYSAHYDVIKRYYGSRARLDYGDTDSLLYDVETDDLEADKAYITAHSEDFGGHSFDGTRLGHFNDEGVVLSEKLSKKLGKPVVGNFVEYSGIAPKLYDLEYETTCGIHKSIKKAKGVPRHILEKTGSEAYQLQMDHTEDVQVTFKRLAKRKLNTFLETTTRRGVCGVDTKTFHESKDVWLPLGHCRTLNSASSSRRDV